MLDDGRHLAGLIEVNCCDPFHRLMRYLTGYSCDLVGFYYRSRPGDCTTSCLVLLYDSYTGRVLTRTTTSLESLRSDPSHVSATLRELSITNSLREREFASVIATMLTHRGVKSVEREASDAKRCLRLTLMRLGGISGGRVPSNGFSIVNQGLLALAGLDYSTRKMELSGSLLELGQLGTPVVYELTSATTSLGGPTPTSTTSTPTPLHFGYLRDLDTLYEVSKDLTVNYEGFFERILPLTSGMSRPLPVEVPSEIPYEISMVPTTPVDSIPDSPLYTTHWLPPPGSCRGESCSLGSQPPGGTWHPSEVRREITIRPRESRPGVDGGRPLPLPTGEVHPQPEGDISSLRAEMGAIFEAERDFLTAMDDLDGSRLGSTWQTLNRLRVRNGASELPPLDLPGILSDVESRVTSLRRRYETALREVSTGKPVIFDLSGMVEDLNAICELHGVTTLRQARDLREGSYTAVATIGSGGLRALPPLQLPITGGEMLVLPTTGADLTKYDTETLEAILHHLEGHDFREKRFTSLRIQAARVLAERQSETH